MSNQPFKDEDVIGRINLPGRDEMLIVQEDDASMHVYSKDSHGWYGRLIHPDDIASLFRQIQVLQERCKELEDALRLIQQSTSGPSCGECAILAYVYAVLDNQGKEVGT
jgi:hypothetical protein